MGLFLYYISRFVTPSASIFMYERKSVRKMEEAGQGDKWRVSREGGVMEGTEE